MGPSRPGPLLAGPIDLDARRRDRAQYPTVDAVAGMEVTHRATGRRGVVTAVGPGSVRMRLANGAPVEIAMRDGAFEVDGRAVSLRRPRVERAPELTASGSVAADEAPARVARASRIWVEGRHDAELLEKVWGDDLRDVGVVVEPLNGADDLAERVTRFAPGPTRRLGILLDHLVDGTKERRIAASVVHEHVLVTGHPFVDVWAAVRPERLGLDEWPTIPYGEDYKTGICRAVGVAEPAEMWRRILGSVRTWTDLDTTLINAVERLIDFVTVAD